MWVLNKGIYENTHFVSDCVNKYVNFQKNSIYGIHRVTFFILPRLRISNFYFWKNTKIDISYVLPRQHLPQWVSLWCVCSPKDWNTEVLYPNVLYSLKIWVVWLPTWNLWLRKSYSLSSWLFIYNKDTIKIYSAKPTRINN